MRRPLLLCLALAGACRPALHPASIEGDVSLVLPGGEPAPGIGSTVRLIPQADSLDAVLDGLCQDYETRFRVVATSLPDSLPIDSTLPSRAMLAMQRPRLLARAARRWGATSTRSRATQVGLDSLRALQDRTEATVHTVLVPATQRRVSAGPEARYRFDSLSPGRYAVWAEARIGDNDYTWWAETTLVAGDAMQLALDRSRLAGPERYCHIR